MGVHRASQAIDRQAAGARFSPNPAAGGDNDLVADVDEALPLVLIPPPHSDDRAVLLDRRIRLQAPYFLLRATVEPQPFPVPAGADDAVNSHPAGRAAPHLDPA